MERKRQEPKGEVLRAFEQRSFGGVFILARMPDSSNASVCPEVQLKKKRTPSLRDENPGVYVFFKKQQHSSGEKMCKEDLAAQTREGKRRGKQGLS